MELVTSVKASSVHACMLGDSFEVKLLPIGDTSLSITSDQVCDVVENTRTGINISNLSHVATGNFGTNCQ